MVRVCATDGVDDFRLRGPIDLAHEVVAPLARHLDGIEPREAADDEVARAAGGADGDVEERLHGESGCSRRGVLE
jgi:hypothetical protein